MCTKEVEEHTIKKRFKFVANKPNSPKVEENNGNDLDSSFIDFNDVDFNEIGQQSTSITCEGNQITYDLLVPNGLLTNDHPHIFKDQSNDEQSKNGQKIFGQNKKEQAKQDQIKTLAVVTTTDAISSQVVEKKNDIKTNQSIDQFEQNQITERTRAIFLLANLLKNDQEIMKSKHN
jgi:hypothetical protein